MTDLNHLGVTYFSTLYLYFGGLIFFQSLSRMSVALTDPQSHFKILMDPGHVGTLEIMSMLIADSLAKASAFLPSGHCNGSLFSLPIIAETHYI